MSNQADRFNPATPTTRAAKRASRRARKAAWRQTPAGHRRTAARQAGYKARNERLMRISDGELFA